MTAFTPLSGLAGGALIGLAAALLLLGTGRIAGISGILGRSLFAEPGDLGWRIAFLVGLPLGAWLTALASGDAMGFALQASPARLVCAGLLVGFGTALGNGCTSGHGVCGISRGSRRSLVATAVFMLAGIATVFVTRHLLGAS
jgi:uncharacterized membrane protein YedE/YeeE